MKLYADSADLSAVLPLLQDALVHGVTTNPTILAKAGRSAAHLPMLCREFEDAGAGEIFIQATGEDRSALLQSSLHISEFGERITVKVPATGDGFRVATELIRRDIRVLLTAVYSLPQATFAASIGVDYIAPYFGRLVDSGEDGLAKVTHMNLVLQETKTRVLVASVRSPNAAATLASNGVRYITADVPVLLAMMVDPVTEASADEFERITRSAGLF